MPIQRVYSLPSCTLQIEGISAEGDDKLSILTGFECKFHHNGSSISGGRELLDHLIESTGKYAQILQTKEPIVVASQLVSLEPIGLHLHKLKVKSIDTRDDTKVDIEVNLNTVQLFDLVESIDSLCTDPQTLLNLNVVIASAISATKSVVSLLPTLIGVSSLAIASAVLFLIPTPKPEKKPEPQPVSLILPKIIDLTLKV